MPGLSRRSRETLELDCEIGSTDVGVLAKRSKLSIETAARFARSAFFVEVARRRRCPRIFLAHHADDLVETALLNLFRGAGPAGIAAMRRISVHHIGKTQLTILRPLLGVWRSEIDAYVREYGLEFREDATNRIPRASRNRIRHRILPDIEKQFGRDVRRTIWRAAQIWSEEEALLDSLVSTELISATHLSVVGAPENASRIATPNDSALASRPKSSRRQFRCCGKHPCSRRARRKDRKSKSSA